MIVAAARARQRSADCRSPRNRPAAGHHVRKEAGFSLSEIRQFFSGFANGTSAPRAL
jgi:hypothetical protein